MPHFRRLFLTLVLILGLGSSVLAVDFQEELQRLARENARGYIGPFATAFGTCMNSGLYHTARPHSFLGFDLSVKISMLQVSDDDLTYEFIFPHAPFPVTNPLDNSVDTLIIDLNQFYANRVTSTVFGDNPAPILTPDPGGVDAALQQAMSDAGWDNNTINMFRGTPAWTQLRTDLLSQIPDFQSVPGIGVDFFGFVMPQVSLGLPFKTEVLVRWAPERDLPEDAGKAKFLGLGLKHSISQYIPLCFVDISAQYSFQKLELGDIIKSNHWAANVEVSKKLGFPALSITPYIGAGLESSTLDLSYTITGSTEPDFNNDGVGDFEGQTVGFDLKGDNKFRGTAGLRLGLAFLTINADVSMGKYTTASLGVGLTIR